MKDRLLQSAYFDLQGELKMLLLESFTELSLNVAV